MTDLSIPAVAYLMLALTTGVGIFMSVKKYEIDKAKPKDKEIPDSHAIEFEINKHTILASDFKATLDGYNASQRRYSDSTDTIIEYISGGSGEIGYHSGRYSSFDTYRISMTHQKLLLLEDFIRGSIDMPTLSESREKELLEITLWIRNEMSQKDSNIVSYGKGQYLIRLQKRKSGGVE